MRSMGTGTVSESVVTSSRPRLRAERTSAPASFPPSPRRRRRVLGWTLLAAEAFSAALALRLALVVPAGFPLNDGGLFYAMARDLQASSFRLPAETSYNGGLPFAYPPLGIYLAAALDWLGPWSLFSVMRFLPLVLSVAAVAAFFLLARELLRSRTEAWLAALWFALLPMAYVWVIMGGGVTRSVGQLLSLLALWQGVRLARDGSARSLGAFGILGGLTFLAHPEAAWFLVYSTPLLWLAFDRSRRGLGRFALAAAIGVVVAAPWLGIVVARHGFDVMRPATDSGWPWYAGLLRLSHLDLTREAAFPLLGGLALIGAVRSIARREWLLPAWVLVAHLAQARAADQRAVVPLAMLAALGLAELVVLVPQWVAAAARQGTAAVVLANGRAKADHGLRLALVAVPLALFVAFATLEAYPPLLSGLSSSERAAMRAAALAPPDATFVVVSGERWFGSDRITEWFPALSGRVALNVVQGHEWTGEFGARMARNEALQACAGQGVECLDRWSARSGTWFEYLFIAKRPFTVDGLSLDGTAALQSFVRTSPRYLVLYDGPGGLIARRLDAVNLP